MGEGGHRARGVCAGLAAAQRRPPATPPARPPAVGGGVCAAAHRRHQPRHPRLPGAHTRQAGGTDAGHALLLLGLGSWGCGAPSPPASLPAFPSLPALPTHLPAPGCRTCGPAPACASRTWGTRWGATAWTTASSGLTVSLTVRWIWLACCSRRGEAKQEGTHRGQNRGSCGLAAGVLGSRAAAACRLPACRRRSLTLHGAPAPAPAPPQECAFRGPPCWTPSLRWSVTAASAGEAAAAAAAAAAGGPRRPAPPRAHAMRAGQPPPSRPLACAAWRPLPPRSHPFPCPQSPPLPVPLCPPLSKHAHPPQPTLPPTTCLPHPPATPPPPPPPQRHPAPPRPLPQGRRPAAERAGVHRQHDAERGQGGAGGGLPIRRIAPGGGPHVSGRGEGRGRTDTTLTYACPGSRSSSGSSGRGRLPWRCSARLRLSLRWLPAGSWGGLPLGPLPP